MRNKIKNDSKMYIDKGMKLHIDDFVHIPKELEEKYPDLIAYFRTRLNGFNLGFDRMNKTDEKVIAKAIKYEEPEIKSLARGLAFAVSYKQLHYYIRHTFPSIENIEEAMQEVFVILAEHLEEYNPEYNITTFITPFVSKFFSAKVSTIIDGSVQLSIHYARSMTLVNKAIQELQSDGINTYTPEILTKYIQTHFDKKVSLITVRKCLELKFVVVQLDWRKDSSEQTQTLEIQDPNAADPAKQLREKEETIEFQEMLNKLRPKSKKILTFFLEFAAKYPDKTIKDAALYNYAKAHGYEGSKSTFSVAFRAAKNEFKSILLNSREINTVRQSMPIEAINMDNHFYTKSDDEGFADAFANDISLLDVENLM